MATAETSARFSALRSALMRFDDVWRVSFFEEDDGAVTLDIRFWGEPRDDAKAQIEREAAAAGFVPVENLHDALGHGVRLQRPAGPQENARQQVREAMEQLSGSERCALATTPSECRTRPLTAAALDRWAMEAGDASEARLHFFGRRPVNFHE